MKGNLTVELPLGKTTLLNIVTTSNCIKQVCDIFEISQIIDEPQEKPQVIDYYLMNKLTCKFGFNWDGFLHCGISYDGSHKKDDFKEDARIVEQYIHEMW